MNRPIKLMVVRSVLGPDRSYAPGEVITASQPVAGDLLATGRVVPYVEPPPAKEKSK